MTTLRQILITLTLSILSIHYHLVVFALTRSNSIERLEECENDQYFSYKEQICRNCSDIQQILYGNQEWLSREVSDFRGRPAGEGQDVQRTSNLSRNGNKQNNGWNVNRLNSNDNDNNIINDNNINNNVVLSRLISVAPQDQDFNSPTEIIDEDVTEPVSSDSSDIVATQTKQIRKLVNRFAQTSLVGDELLEAISQCRQNQNINACQKWSNFCVLSIYSHSSSNTISQSVSNGYEPGISSNSERSNTNWQRCPIFNGNSICNSYRDWYRSDKKASADLQNIFASEDPLLKLGSNVPTRINQPIQLLAYRYSLDGIQLNVDHFGLGDMANFCFKAQNAYDSNNVGSRQIKVGQDMSYDCRFSHAEASWLSKMRSIKDTVFVDLFIGYNSNGATFVRPVPVLIKDILYNGVPVNRKYAKDQSRWKLVHRFFFHSILSLDDVKSNSNGDNEKVLIYPKTVHLEFKLRRQDRGLLLNSILLTIDYDLLYKLDSQEKSNSTNIEADIYKTDLTVSQTLIEMLSLRKDLDLAMTILSILSSIWSLIKCYNLQKFYGSVKLDLNSLFTFIIISCDTMANLFAFVTLLFMSYLYLTVKFHLGDQMFAPNEDLESAIRTNLELAFIFKIIGLIHKIYVHLTADIFFIDWEKPKMLTSSQILNNATNQDGSKSQSTDANSSQNIRFPGVQQQSSFWRPYTIVNRWIQMQTFRRQSTTLQLSLFACIVDIAHLTNLASSDPSLDLSMQDRQGLVSTMSTSFRLLILGGLYLALAFTQVGFRKYIYEPMIRNPAREFVDLCSVANVSVFCMLYPRFGYYIHGRNANGAGDCSIIEINALLEREEMDLCSKRGLAPNTDQQTFVLILPRIINEHYRKLLFTNESTVNQNQLNKQSTPNLSQLSPNNFIGNNLLKSAFKSSASMSSSASFSVNRSIIETMITRNKAINTFLANFLEHFYKDIDYTIRAGRRFENFLMNVDFDDENMANRNGPMSSIVQDKSQAAATFCIDNGDSFTSLLWSGLELDFILIELLTVLMLDLWLNQQPMIITVGIVWLLHNTFKSLYVYYSRHNLISKALIDEKFLVR